jgi:hypothetical protein
MILLSKRNNYKTWVVKDKDDVTMPTKLEALVKNKTNNDNVVDSITATTNDMDARTNNAVRLASVQQRFDADGTKIVVDNTINAMTNNTEPHTYKTVGPT